MKNKTTSIHSTFAVTEEIKSQDTRFLSIAIDVMHTKENLNDSYFAKEDIEKCIDTIKNTPVLGFIKYDKFNGDDFKGHEHIEIKTEDGIEEVYLGSAYGVIPESCNPRWVFKVCEDGQEREFLRVDAILWEKFEDATSIVQRDGEKAQSMELEISSIEGYEDEADGLFHFTSFRFDGCCILGEGVQPAMTGANVSIKNVQFTMNEFVKNLQSELSNKYKMFTETVSNQNEQGGMEMPNTDFSQTLMEQFADISAMVSNYDTVANRWGETCPRYESVDIQDGEVIVVDRKDNYRHYGFPFTVNGDKPVIDFNSGVRKKIQYVNYEEGAVSTPNGAFDFGSYIEQLEKAAYEKIMEANKNLAEMETAKETAETNYSSIKNDYDEIKPKYDEYVKAEVEREQAEIETQKNEMFSQFEKSLGEHPDFVSLKENKADFSVDEIEAKCSILFTRLNRSNFAKTTNKEMTVGIPDNSFSPDDTSVVSARYGNISINK